MNTVYKTLKGIEGFTKNYKRISHIKTALTAVLIIYTVIKFAATGVEIYKALKH